MIIHKETGVTFRNRKECVYVMGTKRYRETLKQGGFIFIEDKKENETETE